jgi:predicted dehydrogenase
MRKLRLGIIGTGIATNDLYFPWLMKLRSRIEIVAVANRRRAKAVAFAKRAGVDRVHRTGEALLRDPEVEAVLLSLPIHLNARWVMKALRAGKHVLCEKPIAATLDEARRLVREAKHFDRVYLVAENYFFTPHIQIARHWVKKGLLGDVRLVEAGQIHLTTPDNKYAKTAWRKRPKHLGGFVADAGVHVANVIRETFGMPTAVSNLTALHDPRLVPIDTAVATFMLPNGALGVFRSCFSARAHGELPLLRAYGSRANLEIYWNRSVLYVHDRKPLVVSSRENGFHHELLHFADAVVRRKKLRFEPRAALLDLELMERIVRQGSLVPIESRH